MLIPLGILASSGGGAAGSYELISTSLIASSTTAVTFDVSTLSSTYKHLQLRWTGRSTNASNDTTFLIRFNSDSTAANYRGHALYGTGSSALSTDLTSEQGIYMYGSLTAANGTANAFSAGVTDILDAFSTTKNKTIRSLHGQEQAYDRIVLNSGVWFSTAAITSIYAYTNQGQWAAGSRLSLYGIKGA